MSAMGDPDPGEAATVSRRGLLRAAAGGLAVGFGSGCSPAMLPVIPRRPRPQAQDVAGWVVHAAGRYTLHLPRVEMGQNIATALKQVACEELGIPWEQLAVHLHGTESLRPVRATVGSESVKDFALPLARACATLREAVAAAGAGAGTGVGAGTVPGEGRGTGQQGAQPLVERLRAFRPGGRFVGQRVPLEQGEALVRGEPLFAADVRRDGMVFGRVLRAPASPELPSLPASFDEAAARAVPGFVAIVQSPLLQQGSSLGLGIVAATPGALERIERALALQWRVEGTFEQGAVDDGIDIDRRCAASRRRHQHVQGDRIDPGPPWDVDLRVDVPLAAHAPIEPRAAVAEFAADGSLQMWVGSQDVFYQRDVVARRLGLDVGRVVVQGCRVGGGFGGKTICTVELEAAVLARAIGRPVKVQWTRAQEFRLGFHRPPSSHRLRGRLREGRLQDWQHDFASSHILFTAAALPAWLQRLTDFVGDDGVARGAMLPYRAARRRIGFDLVRLPVFTGPWRGLGAAPNTFAIESAIDECAVAAGADPVGFRLGHIEDARLARCLRRAAEAAGWRGPAARADGPLRRARGVASGIYKGTSYVAVVADVEVDARSGGVRVTRLVCAHDCGRIVNPDQVRAQCEGNLVWGLGMVLLERLPVAASQVAAATFADSPIPRIGDVPPMEVVLVDEGDSPGGAGETAIVAAGAAIANAVRAATGERPRRLPLRVAPERIGAR